MFMEPPPGHSREIWPGRLHLKQRAAWHGSFQSFLSGQIPLPTNQGRRSDTQTLQLASTAPGDSTVRQISASTRLSRQGRGLDDTLAGKRKGRGATLGTLVPDVTELGAEDAGLLARLILAVLGHVARAPASVAANGGAVKVGVKVARQPQELVHLHP